MKTNIITKSIMSSPLGGVRGGFLLLFLLPILISAQKPLDSYLETAANNSPALKAKFNSYMASLEKVPQVGTLPDPQLVFGYFAMPVETKNGPQRFNVSFTQLFPWFGTLGSREDVFVSAAKVKYELFEEAKSKLFFDVRSTYYDLYFIGKGIDITTENIRILNSFKRLALIKIEAGKASGVDELRAEMELADLENSLALLKDRKRVFTVKFNNLLNVDNNSSVEIPETLLTTDILLTRQAILDTLTIKNHEIRSLDYLFQSYRDKEVLAKKTGTPNIIVGADYINIGKVSGVSGSGKDALLFKVGITLPFYRKKYTGLVNEALYLQQTVQNQKDNKINILETLFEKVYSEYADAGRRITLFNKQSDFASKAIRILESEYSSNGKNFEEILRMERNLLKYSLELEKARADKQAAVAFIDYLTGR
jgi:outer membrane protein TolC